MSSTVEVDSYTEDGENRFSHQLPKPVSHPNLVLKRGIVEKDSPLVEWCKEVLENGFAKPIEPKDIIVKLLDETGSPTRSWALSNCFPVKWDVDGFDSTTNSLSIETIELDYNVLRRDD